jgi:hypothetical protein
MDRETAHQHLIAKHGHEAVATYISEFEHMEGVGCWSMFDTLAELFEDYDLFVANGGVHPEE